MRMKKCPSCKRYTMREICQICGRVTINPFPPKFSPVNKFGKWRRRLIKERL